MYQGFYACCLQAQCRDLYIFTSSIAKKKDTGASSYKVDSNMGILGFFWWDQISINQTYPFKVLQGTRFGTPGQNHESLTLPKHQFCFGRYKIVGNKDIYIHFIIRYPLHIVLHSGFEFLKLQFFCNPNNQNPLIVCECSRWHRKGLSGWPRVPSENGNASDATKPKQYIEKHKRREILQILSAHAL